MSDAAVEPLLCFDAVVPALAAATERVDTLVARYRRDMAAGRVLPNSVEAMRVELTYHSNAIEGNTLTLRDTQLVIEGREPNTGKSLREIYEARNHDRALRMLEKRAETRPLPEPLAERDLLDTHAQVMADIDPDAAEWFRTGRVLITGTRFVPPGSQKFPTLIPALLELAHRAELHPAIRAAEFHYNFVAIHPFGYGNGRTARLVMNYQFRRHGYPYVIVPVERRAEYLAALEAANGGRAEPFAAFILGCVEESVTRLIGDEE